MHILVCRYISSFLAGEKKMCERGERMKSTKERQNFVLLSPRFQDQGHHTFEREREREREQLQCFR